VTTEPAQDLNPQKWERSATVSCVGLRLVSTISANLQVRLANPAFLAQGQAAKKPLISRYFFFLHRVLDGLFDSS
jgi:hypothetical protein